MNDAEKQNSRFQHVYAVVRIDFPLDVDSPENTIAVVKVHSSKSDAESEVSRLKEINQKKGCNYILYTTRLVP